MKRILFLALVTISLSNTRAQAQSDDLNMLARWMSGSFSSEFQHLKDSTNYFDIRLEIVPIWKERKDGYWFYVEQAVATSPEKPYRQRVYHLAESKPGTFESSIFTMRDPLRFTGHPEKMEALTIDSLNEKEGCSVTLQLESEGRFFSGSTTGKACPSEIRGAVYATSEVTVTKHELRSWDRGFNAKGEQVWGSETGPYIFVKMAEAGQ